MTPFPASLDGSLKDVVESAAPGRPERSWPPPPRWQRYQRFPGADTGCAPGISIQGRKYDPRHSFASCGSLREASSPPLRPPGAKPDRNPGSLEKQGFPHLATAPMNPI